MAIRLAGRIGKGVSETLQDGLIYLSRAHGWSVSQDEDEKLDEGKRESVYAFWAGLNAVQRGAILDLMDEDDDVLQQRLESLHEQKLLMQRLAALEEDLATSATSTSQRGDAASVELSVRVTGDDETRQLVDAMARTVASFGRKR